MQLGDGFGGFERELRAQQLAEERVERVAAWRRARFDKGVALYEKRQRSRRLRAGECLHQTTLHHIDDAGP
jgi:hypothetical protein